MIHRKHKLKIKELVERVGGELERELERQVDEICGDLATVAVNTAVEYTARLKRDVIFRVIDAKTAIREGRVEEAVEKLDELLALLDL